MLTLDGRRTWGENTTAMASSLVLVLLVTVAGCRAGDINRQSIVFHEETPEVFYCPQVKMSGRLLLYGQRMSVPSNLYLKYEYQ